VVSKGLSLLIQHHGPLRYFSKNTELMAIHWHHRMRFSTASISNEHGPGKNAIPFINFPWDLNHLIDLCSTHCTT